MLFEIVGLESCSLYLLGTEAYGQRTHIADGLFFRRAPQQVVIPVFFDGPVGKRHQYGMEGKTLRLMDSVDAYAVDLAIGNRNVLHLFVPVLDEGGNVGRVVAQIVRQLIEERHEIGVLLVCDLCYIEYAVETFAEFVERQCPQFIEMLREGFRQQVEIPFWFGGCDAGGVVQHIAMVVLCEIVEGNWVALDVVDHLKRADYHLNAY